MELESKMMLGQQFCEFAIREQQGLLFSAGQKKIGSRFGIRGPKQNKRIVAAARLASGWTKDRVVVP